MKREDAQYPINIHGEIMKDWKTTTGSLYDPHNVSRETINELLEERNRLTFAYTQSKRNKTRLGNINKQIYQIDLALADLGYEEKAHGFID